MKWANYLLLITFLLLIPKSSLFKKQIVSLEESNSYSASIKVVAQINQLSSHQTSFSDFARIEKVSLHEFFSENEENADNLYQYFFQNIFNSRLYFGNITAFANPWLEKTLQHPFYILHRRFRL